MQDNYKLVGILNLFDIVPDFVYPIFERDNQYYFITGDQEALKTEGFEVLKDAAVKRIIRLSDLKINEFKQREFSKESTPIFAFQVSAREVYLGFFEEIKEFLKNLETEDEILKRAIEDFINNTGNK